MTTTATTPPTAALTDKIDGFYEDGTHFEIRLDGATIRTIETLAGATVGYEEDHFDTPGEARDAFEFDRDALWPTVAADESATYDDEVDGPGCTIARHGTQVVFTNAAGLLTSISYFRTAEEAAADYASYGVDPVAETPRRGDTVRIHRLGARIYRVREVIGRGQHGWTVKVAPAVGNRFGRSLNVELVPGTYALKTRPLEG